MHDDSIVAPRSRARYFPYVFGTLTGVAVALAVISLIMLKRGQSVGFAPTSQHSTQYAVSADGDNKQNTIDTISDDRRNAIVRST